MGCEVGTEATMSPETFHLDPILGVRKSPESNGKGEGGPAHRGAGAPWAFSRRK